MILRTHTTFIISPAKPTVMRAADNRCGQSLGPWDGILLRPVSTIPKKACRDQRTSTGVPFVFAASIGTHTETSSSIGSKEALLSGPTRERDTISRWPSDHTQPLGCRWRSIMSRRSLCSLVWTLCIISASLLFSPTPCRRCSEDQLPALFLGKLKTHTLAAACTAPCPAGLSICPSACCCK